MFSVVQKAATVGVDWWAFGMVLYELLTGLPPWYSHDQCAVVSGILRGTLTFPENTCPKAISLISGLLRRNPAKRLGSTSSDEVLNHPFFEGVDWSEVKSKAWKAPFVPEVPDYLHNFADEFTSLEVGAEEEPGVPEADDKFNGFSFSREDGVTKSAEEG